MLHAVRSAPERRVDNLITRAHDATALMASGPFPKLGSVLIDVGTEDNFDADGQLRIESFEAAAAAAKAEEGVARSSASFKRVFGVAREAADRTAGLSARAALCKRRRRPQTSSAVFA